MSHARELPPLRPIQDQDDLDRALSAIDTLMRRGDLNLQERAHLQAMVVLAEAYEDQTFERGVSPFHEVLAHHLEQAECDESDVERVLGSLTAARSLLSGARAPTLAEVDQLARALNLPLDRLVSHLSSAA